MADIAFTGTITISPTSQTPLAQDISLSAEMAGDNYVHNKQTIPTSTTALDLGSVATPGVAWFKNCDTVNFIEVYNGSGGAIFLRLLPGECWPVRLPPTCAPYAKADTASVKLEYLIAAQ